MYKLKNLSLWLITIPYSFIFGAAFPDDSHLTATDYYSKHSYENKIKNNEPRNAPVLMLFDRTEIEDEDGDGEGSITSELTDAIELIQNDILPLSIIANASLVSNYLKRSKPCVLRFNSTGIIREKTSSKLPKDINTFSIPNTDLFLLQPTWYSDTGNTGFDLPKLSKISEPTRIDDIAKEQQETLSLHSYIPPSLSASTLKEILLPHEKMPNLTWDVRISGHGSECGRIIAGIEQQNLRDLLILLNTTLKTGTASLCSCFIAGQKHSLIFDNFALKKLTYILIINGIAQEKSYRSGLFGKYFLYAANICKGYSLNKLLESITDTSLITPGIPQVLLPGGMHFQTLSRNPYLFRINTVTARVAQEEKKYIEIPKTAYTVLIYPHALDGQVVFSPEKRLSRKKAMLPEETTGNINRGFSHTLYPRLVPIRNYEQRILDQYIGSINLQKEDYISFTPTSGTGRPKGLYAGIAQFLSDAFIQSDAPQNIYIGTLEGPNDFTERIGFWLENRRSIAQELETAKKPNPPTTNIHDVSHDPLFKPVQPGHAPETITLSKMVISMLPSKFPATDLTINISFIFDKSRYNISTTVSHTEQPFAHFKLFEHFDGSVSISNSNDPDTITNHIDFFNKETLKLHTLDDPLYDANQEKQAGIVEVLTKS
jgi:hypothetical protein